MFVNTPKFAAKYIVSLETEDLELIRQTMTDNPDVFTRREDKDDWIFQGGSIASLMGLTSEHEELLNAYSSDSDAMAKVTLSVDDYGSTLQVQTNHAHTAELNEEAVVLDGVFKKLLPEELFNQAAEHWKKMTLASKNHFYYGGIPENLPDHLKEEPNQEYPGNSHSYLRQAFMDLDVGLFIDLLNHPGIIPDTAEILAGWFPNSETKREMLTALIDHHSTTLGDLTTDGGKPLRHARREGGTKEYTDHLIDRIRELGGSV